MCHRGNKHFDVRFLWIRPVLFPTKDGNDAAYEVRNRWKGVYFPPELEFFFVSKRIKVLFATCTLTFRVNIYVSRQGKDINKRNKIIFDVINIYDFGTVVVNFVAFHFNCC